jgi:hypothetical protein
MDVQNVWDLDKLHVLISQCDVITASLHSLFILWEISKQSIAEENIDIVIMCDKRHYTWIILKRKRSNPHEKRRLEVNVIK